MGLRNQLPTFKWERKKMQKLFTSAAKMKKTEMYTSRSAESKTKYPQKYNELRRSHAVVENELNATINELNLKVRKL